MTHRHEEVGQYKWPSYLRNKIYRIHQWVKRQKQDQKLAALSRTSQASHPRGNKVCYLFTTIGMGEDLGYRCPPLGVTDRGFFFEVVCKWMASWGVVVNFREGPQKGPTMFLDAVWEKRD
ncbi:hypothetical protein JTE90_008445 [Oedothorax gibbosus]|uniref:Uncharacterized protein n=1 Tax=Oedothorax gibbosus TaxID=931172 RepID=A0AAV6UTN0_9ARAC|nr:hypothetical protein JTE90_008445 [Oedothorax gibbosus]